MMNLERIFREADEAGIRLEIVGGLPVWESSPVIRHQKAVDRIRTTIRPATTGAGEACSCVHYADIQICFPDGSHKRPDIAIFCREPDEQDVEVTLLPEAVVEILSKGYESKDLEVGVPFYRRSGVKDVVVLEPETGAVLHYQNNDPARELNSPTEIALTCGCQCTV